MYFRRQGVTPPPAYRATVPFGAAGWLTAESYTRSEGAAFSDRFSVVADPANPANHVLRLASPAHTDATVIRPSQALPPGLVSLLLSLIITPTDFPVRV